MYQHVINNNLLVDEQFGFITNSSTITATSNLTNEITDAVKKKRWWYIL
jgi:hypothetical protein